MNLGQYELYMKRVEDAQQWYYQSEQQYNSLRTAVADAALAGEPITDELKDAVASAKQDMRLAQELFIDAKAEMIATIERIQL